ncbi:hypothetical protein B0H19DRAFT_1225922 [Mycena capillaripes]|nr:hypothetical protein B0H19DRAFT_1225922 [Mycena capillaripes]
MCLEIAGNRRCPQWPGKDHTPMPRQATSRRNRRVLPAPGGCGASSFSNGSEGARRRPSMICPSSSKSSLRLTCEFEAIRLQMTQIEKNGEVLLRALRSGVEVMRAGFKVVDGRRRMGMSAKRRKSGASTPVANPSWLDLWLFLVLHAIFRCGRELDLEFKLS